MPTTTPLSTSFSVTFAGIPLLLDTGTVIRHPPPETPYGKVEDQTCIRKQQPEADIIDEINRLLDMGYLQDFHLSTLFHNRNLTAIARPSMIGPQPGPQVHIGDYYYPTTASRWSVYRGLVTSSMVKQLLQIVGTQTSYIEGFGFADIPAWKSAPFVMTQIPASPNAADASLYVVATNLFMLPPRPLAEHGGGMDGLFLLTLVDERLVGIHTPITLKITSSTTWDQVIQQLAIAQNITISYSPISAAYGRPDPDSQLWCNQETVGVLFDAVAANLGRVVVRNLNGTYTLQTYEEAQEWVCLNRGSPAEAVVRFAGGDMFNSGTQLLKAGDLRLSKNAVVPANVQVTFPNYVVGNDPVPHYLNSRHQNPRPTSWYEQSYGSVYSVNIPASSGGSLMFGVNGVSGYTHTIHTTAKALYSGEVQAADLFNVPLNASGGLVSGGFTEGLALWVVLPNGVATGYNILGQEIPGAMTSGITSLSNLASRLAIDYYYGQTLEALDESYPGIYRWTPEGFHDIIWRFSARTKQTTTRVMKRQWNTVIREMQHGTPLTLTLYQPGTGFYLQNLASVPGCGGLSVAQTWRDTNSFSSGLIQTTLSQTYSSGSLVLALNDIGFLPTQNRWKARINSGQIDDETLLLEGTSGGIDTSISVNVVLQGLDGSFPNSHANGSTIQPIPQFQDGLYGVNLLTFEKNQFIYPQEMQSGGITGVRLVPQMQTVYNNCASGLVVSGLNFFSGTVSTYDLVNGNPYISREYVWLQGLNNMNLTSGIYYQGVLAEYSPNISGHTAPVYLVEDTSTVAGGIASGLGTTSGYISGSVVTNITCQSGVLTVTTASLYLGWISGFIVSGFFG